VEIRITLREHLAVYLKPLTISMFLYNSCLKFLVLAVQNKGKKLRYTYIARLVRLSFRLLSLARGRFSRSFLTKFLSYLYLACAHPSQLRKVKFHPRIGHEDREGCRGVAPSGVEVYLHSSSRGGGWPRSHLRRIILGKKPGSFVTGGRVDPKSDVSGCRKYRTIWIRSPDNPACLFIVIHLISVP
jgi:hypothetical protein